MYYFEILKILKEAQGEYYTARDIYFILSAESNWVNMKKALTKMYLKNEHIERQWITLRDEQGKTWREYVYFFRN